MPQACKRVEHQDESKYLARDTEAPAELRKVADL